MYTTETEIKKRNSAEVASIHSDNRKTEEPAEIETVELFGHT